jgi:hypothetical protein
MTVAGRQSSKISVVSRACSNDLNDFSNGTRLKRKFYRFAGFFLEFATNFQKN